MSLFPIIHLDRVKVPRSFILIMFITKRLAKEWYWITEGK